MTQFAETPRWAKRRRPFERLERHVVRMWLKKPDEDARPIYEGLRYSLNFAKLIAVRNVDGQDVWVEGPLALHAQEMLALLETPVTKAETLWDVVDLLPQVMDATRRSRASLLEHMPIDRDSLEAEVTTRQLGVASGGGGGAGYVYPGAYEMLERNGLVPDLMSGTSIGALMSMFRAKFRRYDFAPFVDAARRLTWTNIFRVFEAQSRYGLPATLRLQLRNTLGDLFIHPEEPGRKMWMSDMEIPLMIVATGITVDALKHDLEYYENLIEQEVSRSGVRVGVRTGFKAIAVLREFLGNRDALYEVVLGRDSGTEHFDTLDAAGFSAAIPGILHYDVLREDPRMHRILDSLYADYGITRLGEGGVMSNVPARIAWESLVSGQYSDVGRRNCFILALDCFAPSANKIAWFPFQQAVRSANVDADRAFSDLYIDFPRTLSPMNLVPPLRDALMAIRWGRERARPRMPFVVEMMRPLEVLRDAPETPD